MKVAKLLIAFVLTFALALPASAMTGNEGEPVHYVVIGDSLAAGMIQDSSIGQGYTDYLAEMLEDEGLLASYVDEFAVPGFRTTNVLAELEKDVTVKDSETEEELSLLEELAKADLVTISIGANDVLAGVSLGADGKLSYDPLKIGAAINTAAKNVGTILQKVKALNPDVNIFVMGYYNPFPHAAEYKAQFDQLVQLLDGSVKQVVEAEQMYFVPVAETLASNTEAYLPNPLNIHPSEAGYKAIADVFLEPVMEYVSLIDLPQVIDEPTFTDVAVDAWMFDYVEFAAYEGWMKGYEDGTFRPNNKLKRVHLTSMMARALQLEETKQPPYTDISKYAEATQLEIAAVYKIGVLPEAKLFKPMEEVTRLEFAHMLDKAYTYKTGKAYKTTTQVPFTDVASYTAADKRVMTMLYELEIATGDNGKFKPQGTVTRAHAAKMLTNFYMKAM